MGRRRYTMASPREPGVYLMRVARRPGTGQFTLVRSAPTGTGRQAWLEGDQGDDWVPVSRVRWDTGERPEWLGPLSPTDMTVEAKAWEGGDDE